MSEAPTLPDRAAVKKRRSPWRIVGAVIGLLVILVLAAAIVGWWLLLRAENPVAAGAPVKIDVKKGSSAADIAEQLAAKGVVPNALMFRLRARDSELSGKFKPGSYVLATGMPYDLVFQKLTSGPDVVYFDVTIPEGYTATRVAARISKATGIPVEELTKLVTTGAPEFAAQHPYLVGAEGGSLEGFLFPKTYRIKEGASARSVVEQMLDQFDAEIAKVDLSYAKSKNLTVTDVVIIASILERETQLSKEYPLVASVIYNRLRTKKRLELDSTVFYTLPDGTKVIKRADLDRVTPYNTYRRSGLPAGPISNPGLKALDAAANPAQTNYLFYVLTSKDGSQTFTTNYADHLKAVAKYRKVFGIK
jgi:UPF0755 protein